MLPYNGRENHKYMNGRIDVKQINYSMKDYFIFSVHQGAGQSNLRGPLRVTVNVQCSLCIPGTNIAQIKEVHKVGKIELG